MNSKKYEHDEWNLLEELRNVSTNQPLQPGDTISHTQAYELCRRGLITRDGESCWVLTPEGRQHLSLAGDSTKRLLA